MRTHSVSEPPSTLDPSVLTYGQYPYPEEGPHGVGGRKESTGGRRRVDSYPSNVKRYNPLCDTFMSKFDERLLRDVFPQGTLSASVVLSTPDLRRVVTTKAGTGPEGEVRDVVERRDRSLCGGPQREQRRGKETLREFSPDTGGVGSQGPCSSRTLKV